MRPVVYFAAGLFVHAAFVHRPAWEYVLWSLLTVTLLVAFDAAYHVLGDSRKVR